MAIKYVVNPLAASGLAPINDVSGFVTGPASATDNAVVRFDATTGKLVQNSSVTVSDSGVVTLGADGVSSLDAVTVQQLQAVQSGVQIKQGVVCATTANITLLGEQTIDGVLTSSSRVLVKNQSVATQNGIYVSSAGAWARGSDMDTASEFLDALVTVEDGTANANTGWYQTTNPVTVGVSNIVFIQFFGAGTYAASGDGIKLTGSTFVLSLDGSTLSQSASGVKVATGGITNTEVSASAAIDYSKLNLTSSIVNTDVSGSAAIAYSKLNLSNSILNADINSAAAIAFSKLASLTSAHILVGSAGNVATDVAVSGDISLTNAGVTAYSGTVPLNKGGTGQTTKAPAFDALQPMTTIGDIIVGSTAGTGIRLANGTAGYVLTAQSGAPPAWAPSSASATPTVVRYTRNTAQTIPNSTITIVNFANSTYDPDSLVTTGASWHVTFTKAGYYVVQTKLQFTDTTSTTSRHIYLYKNGSQFCILMRLTAKQLTSSVADTNFAGESLIQVDVGDTVDIRVDQNTGGNLDLANDGAPENYVNIYSVRYT